MADLVPFRALRYHTPDGDLSAVIAPPYDVISATQQESLYDRSPHNVVRLEYSRAPLEERYDAVARDLRDWREQGILRVENRPALYRYVQRFQHQGRTYERRAVFGRVKLEPLDAGVIRPHEFTMSGPKADRLALLTATGTNISPVYSLVDDPDGRFKRALEAAAADGIARGVDLLGIEHEIEVLTDVAALNAIREAVNGRHLYIADGHHRYETALNYQREHPDDPNAGHVLMAITATDDPGLLILPIHRIVRPSSRPDDLEAALAATFDLEDAGAMDDAETLTRAGAALHASTERVTLAALGVRPGRVLLLHLRDRAAVEARMPAERSAAWKTMAVNVLQFGVLEPLFGIDAAALAAGEHVEFSEDLREAAAAVRDGHAPFAFLVPAVRADEIVAVADAGDRMPQKSTYFYPKLGTGLVLNALDA